MASASSDTRSDVLACIREFPGIHLRAIERELGISSALVHYHVKKLEGEGHVLSAPVGGYLRFYPKEAVGPRGMSETDREVLASLREEVPFHVVLVLLEHGPMNQVELADRLSLAKSTVSYHVEKLEARGLVARRGHQGTEFVVRVAEPRRVRRLLRKYSPTQGLVDKFSDLWEDFYG